MSDEVYKALAAASTGFVESPAGCGKTEAIVRTVALYCAGTQLVLTHTHAGVDALRRRFRELKVPADKYHVDTIAGWAWGWVRRYPSNAEYPGAIEIAVWNDVYTAMAVLLKKDFVRKGISNSYSGIIVDEYQDCTIAMHRLVVALKALLPCRILGDDLQGIFGFANDPLVVWADVKTEFALELGALETPFRWLKAQNKPLGDWLISARQAFHAGQEPCYDGSPIARHKVGFADVGTTLIRLTKEKEGRICVIGPKARPLSSGLETTLVKLGYRVLEPNELSVLRGLVIALTDCQPPQQAKAVSEFFARVYGGLGDSKKFIEKIARGDQQKPRQTDRKALYQKHSSGTTPQLVADLLVYLERASGVSCKLRESVSALKCILEEHLQTGADIKQLYAEEIAKRKHQNRSNIRRSIGSTLLVKGLEFEHAVILRGTDWQKSWGGHKDLYVALTRGAKTTTLLEYSN